MATAQPPEPSTSKEEVYARDPKPQTDPGKKDKRPMDEDSDDDSLMFDGFASAEIGSMPELMALLQDDEILAKFQCPTTSKYLREISMDPSKIETLLKEPEIAFLVDKIKAQYEKSQRHSN